MDDGTEDDYDSHIMVWQVADGEEEVVRLSTSQTSLASSALPPSTRHPSTQSSIELGPTPGSGMALDSMSEGASNASSDTESEAPSIYQRSASPTPPYHPALEPLAWSNDIESMLNNPPPSTFHSFNLSREPSLSSWVLPSEPETQPATMGLEMIPEAATQTKEDDSTEILYHHLLSKKPTPQPHSPSPQPTLNTPKQTPEPKAKSPSPLSKRASPSTEPEEVPSSVRAPSSEPEPAEDFTGHLGRLAT